MKQKDIMFELLSKLKSKGFDLHYYNATTDSCYIKLDYGTCGSIRIADHKGIEKYKYTFNLMLDLNKSYKKDNRNYYCLDDLDKMINDIIAHKKELENKFDYEMQKQYWKECCYRKRKGFWQFCTEF